MLIVSRFILLSLLLASSGWQTAPGQAPQSIPPAPTTKSPTKSPATRLPLDGSDALIRHLLRRNSAMSAEISRLQNSPGNPTLVEDGLGRLAQYLLDSEASIEDHNRRHPESPWASVKDVLRELCGDCTRERRQRNLQLAEEATGGGF